MGGMSSPSPSDLPRIESLTVGPVIPLPTKSETPKVPKDALLSLTSSARRLTRRNVERLGNSRKGGSLSWQSDAWDIYDLVGELRFLANVLANRGAQARFFVGTLDPNDPLAAPTPTEDAELSQILDHLGKATTGRTQLVQRLLVNYFIGGDGYQAGIPSRLIPSDQDLDDAEAAPVREITPYNPSERSAAPKEIPIDDLSDLEWFTLSPREVSVADGKAKIKLPRLAGKEIEVDLDEIWLIYSWRQHPERGWEPDSPTRSNLPVLRELVGLTMAISGQIDSRLTGAGLLAVDQRVSDAARAVAQELLGDVPLPADADPFMDSLIEAMAKAIEDRSSAASFAPVGVVVPEGVKPSEAFHHYTFDNVLDKEYVKLRDEAIRRFALGSDAPPELLLGVGGMNHWGAWLVREDVVTAHIEPPLAVVADAWTTEYLRPAMRAAGRSEEEIDNTVVWYSVEHLIARPNAGDDAIKLYDRGELSGTALRAALGFDDADAPPVIGSGSDPAVDLALQLIAQAPSLMQAPGLPAIVEQIRIVQSGREATAQAVEDGTGVEGGGDAGDAADRPAEEDAPADGPPAEVNATGGAE